MQEKILKLLEITAKTAGFGEPQSIPQIIGAIIATFLSLLGVVFLCLIIYAGFLWMLSAGNESKVLHAKQTITRAIIGLIIILSSYTVSYFVMKVMVGVTV